MLDIFKSSELRQVCQENNIEFLGLFGSFARNEQKDSSDIDLLVRFDKRVGYFKLLEVQDKLKTLLGYDVDLVTENALSTHIKPFVQKDMQTIYG